MPAVEVSVTILAFGAEPWLEPCVGAVLDSTVKTEVILVDNGCTDGGVERLSGHDRVTVVQPGRNLGFPGGCNLGAQYARGEVLAFVNADAIVAPDALGRLAQCALRPDVGIATASVRLADAPDRLNSGGNEIHFLGLSWSGAFGEIASAYADERSVAGASGAAMAISRSTWTLLDGFEEQYFLYHEDAELSLRCWLKGHRVVFVPDAVVRHRYEFSRNRQKFYLIERNRLTMLLTVFERRTLLLLAPGLIALELAMLASGARRGWAGDKVKGWVWLVRNRDWVRSRRRTIQQSRVIPDGVLAPLLSSRIDPGNFDLPGWIRPFDWLLSCYWAITKRFLRRSGRTESPGHADETTPRSSSRPVRSTGSGRRRAASTPLDGHQQGPDGKNTCEPSPTGVPHEHSSVCQKRRV